MKYLIQVLFNTALGTWHPIYYQEAPLPGSLSGEANLVRFKSKAHQMVGSPTREAALKNVDERLRPIIAVTWPGCTIIEELEHDVQWDGEGIPAYTTIRTT